MRVKINNVHVFFSAIESLEYEKNEKCVILRTVSGVVHKMVVESPEQGESIIDNIITNVAMAS